MRILVTGATGFIGFHLSQRLAEEGHNVYGLVRFASQPHRLPEGVTPLVGDLTDYSSIVKCVEFVRPEVVFHLGALTPVSESYHQPVTYAMTNYIGTIHLLEAVRKHAYESVRLIVVAGTTEMYDSPKIDDEEKYQPKSPYAISKVASVLYTEYVHRAYGLPIVIAVPSNTYGRARVNQRHFFVEKLIVSMLKGAEELQLGNPDAVRDWMFREDHVEAYLSILDAMDKEIFGQKFYFGTGVGRTTKEVFEAVRRLTGWEGRVIWHVYARPSESQVLVINPKKANEVLGWKAKYSLEEGLKRAIEEWREVLGL